MAGPVILQFSFFCKEKFWCWQAAARQLLNVILKGHMAGLGGDESEFFFIFSMYTCTYISSSIWQKLVIETVKYFVVVDNKFIKIFMMCISFLVILS